MMAEPSDLGDLDDNVVLSLKRYGKKIKGYELVQMLKADFACSELEIKQSLVRLIGSRTVRKTGSGEYLLVDYQ